MMQHYCWSRCYFFFLACTASVFVGAFSSNSSNMKVAIVGGTGQLGRRTVSQLLDRKVPVKCLIRQDTPPDFLAQQEKQHPGLVEFVTNGDVTDEAKVRELLTGCSHCLAMHGATRRSKWYELLTAASGSEDDDSSHAKQVNYNSMKTFCRVAKETGSCRQIVRITGKGEEPWSVFSVLINGLGSMAKGWNYEGEEVLRQQTDVDYTIIRPGIMKADYDDAASDVHMKLADNGGDLKVSVVSYDQVAELCIESILHPEAKRTTLTAMNVEGEGPSIGESLMEVQKDTRIFPTSLIDEHKRAVKTVFRSLAGVFLAILAGILLR